MVTLVGTYTISISCSCLIIDKNNLVNEQDGLKRSTLISPSTDSQGQCIKAALHSDKNLSKKKNMVGWRMIYTIYQYVPFGSGEKFQPN